MRMWMVDPRGMCRQHLLGEHLEGHMFITSANKGMNLDRFVYKWAIFEPCSLISRHDELVEEMLRRGYSHNSPTIPVEQHVLDRWPDIYIDREASKWEILQRCSECRLRFGELDDVDYSYLGPLLKNGRPYGYSGISYVHLMPETLE